MGAPRPGEPHPGPAGRIAVVSALMGVVGGDEPVPDHRLKLSVSLGRLGRLDRWWRPAVTEALVVRGRSPIVDLLPQEHAAAVDWDALSSVGPQTPHPLVTASAGWRRCT